ncbi:MAG: urease accessory protein UreD [Pseudomonadota bacterium]
MSLTVLQPKAQRAIGEGAVAWSAEAGCTALANLRQQGCAKIRLPKQHSREATPEAVFINSSGGMTGGDRLQWSVTVNDAANARITTQACERVYRSSGGTARADVKLKLGKGASLAWLPQETILFDGGSLSRTIHVDMDETASLLMVEPLIFGRTAMGEDVSTGYFRDRWRITQNGGLLHAEDLLLGGTADAPISQTLAKKFIADGNLALATLVMVDPRGQSFVEPLRAILGQQGGALGQLGAAGWWNGKLVARIIAKDGYALRQSLVPALHLLSGDRPLPRCWHL